MPVSLPDSISKVIKLWSRLPGVGEKTARRMVFYLLRQEPELIREFAAALASISVSIRHCRECGNVSDSDICPVCADNARDRSVICVVESDEDCVAIEQAGIFNGLYHVLGGRVSPLDNQDIPEESLNKLRQRIIKLGVKEIILATTPRIEGDLSAFAVQEAVKDTGVKVSRLSYGLPVGGSIGFADRVTLHMALESRRSMK